MCVTQFRDYCKASHHKLYDDIKSTDKVMPYDPYKGINGDLYCCFDIKKIQELAMQGNEYAIEALKKHEI